MKTTYALAIHGGAGTLLRSEMSDEKEQLHRDALNAALAAGEAVLSQGGTAMDAVIASVQSLEDCPLFNAGTGAVFTNNGFHELDASLMEGHDRRAGAVCAVRRIKNPILLCREVMDSEFVMLNGPGAEQFAAERGFEFIDNSSLSTQFRKDQLVQAIEANRVQLDHNDTRHKMGTVGAVARDRHGNLAAATSTGGMTNKKYGRVGDSALIGSGTWADNRSCAVSATGWGEFFIRSGVAGRIATSVQHGVTLEEACRQMIFHEVETLGGDGGVIAIDNQGNISMPFNTPGMYRGWVKEGGNIQTAIFAEGGE
jgi:L-asparaginase / beta-aspartyl-peptidase